MELFYEITETAAFNENIGKYLGYGILCRGGDGEAAETKDISPERERVEFIAKILKRENVEPVHLYDIIYDMLAGNFI